MSQNDYEPDPNFVISINDDSSDDDDHDHIFNNKTDNDNCGKIQFSENVDSGVSEDAINQPNPNFVILNDDSSDKKDEQCSDDDIDFCSENDNSENADSDLGYSNEDESDFDLNKKFRNPNQTQFETIDDEGFKEDNIEEQTYSNVVSKNNETNPNFEKFDENVSSENAGSDFSDSSEDESEVKSASIPELRYATHWSFYFFSFSYIKMYFKD